MRWASDRTRDGECSLGKQWWERAGASWGKNQLQEINYFALWSWLLPCLDVLLHTVSKFQQYLVMAGIAARDIWNCLRSQEEGDMRPCRLTLWKMTRDFCCLASQSSDTCTVQKKHFHYKLIQSDENIKASVILSYLEGFHPQHFYGSRARRRMRGRGISYTCLNCCLFVCLFLSSCIVKLVFFSINF